ncbi:MAG: U32 family peptidase [Elusimicrobia bacterium]|nr:U32 family peptidase [Elusimicrobiota bacterium]
MELLAPVGSKESFITAIRAGADAVYVGVPDFNARVSAASINFYDLEVMIDHAREKKVTVFLALNILIKHEEISAVVKNIARIDRFAPDALIVQDLGVASIVRKYFPHIPLHASTQMAVHNRMGVDFLAREGFARAILARELSFSELKIIAKGAPLPIEIFVHGALCFCVSGMCLFSSFIGGLSGNRGRCTQPCRRLWHQGKKQGYIFSPRDLELAPHIGALKKIGIASLKIEGRMRSSEYVYKVVSAYRMLIDASEHDFDRVLVEARMLLSGDAARAKTAGLFAGRDAALFEPHKAQCLGNRIGTVVASRDEALLIEGDGASIEIREGDRLRVSNPVTDTTIAFKVKEFSIEGLLHRIPFTRAAEFKPGNPVYKTVDAAFDQKNLECDIDAIYENYARRRGPLRKAEFQVSQGYTALISNIWKETKKSVPVGPDEDTLWVTFDTPAWLEVLPPPDKHTQYVFYIKKDNLHLCAALPEALMPHIAGELPPFIGQRDTDHYRRCIDALIARGVRRWVLNNVSQFAFFEGRECELTAGHQFGVWNAYTAAFLATKGVTQVVTAWEDDFLNIRKMCAPGLGRHVVVYLYGFIPVVRSRFLPGDTLGHEPIREHVLAESPAVPAAFTAVNESELVVLIPEKPVGIFTARRKLKECGISAFGIDLSFIKPNKKIWQSLLSAYRLQENIPGTEKFNFKREVK